MVKTLQRRTFTGANIPTTLRLRVKLSPSGRALWAGTDAAITPYRRVWNGTNYVEAIGANHVGNDVAVAWTEDETYQVAIGSVGSVRTLFLRSFNISTGANTLLHSVGPVLDAAVPQVGIERITGDYFIAYINNRTLVFTINRTTNQLVIIADLAATMTQIRGIATRGTDNIIVVHSGNTNATNGLQTYSVNLATGVLTPIGSKYIPGDGRINGFDFRAGKVLTHSFYGLQNVLFLELDGSNALVPVPGYNAIALNNNMSAASAQTTTSFIHLAFDATEITYLDQNEPATFWSANKDTLTRSTAFAAPPTIPSGTTNGRTYGDQYSRVFASYSDDGKVMAFTCWTAAALTGVYVFSEYEETSVEFIASPLLPTATVEAAVVTQAELVGAVPLPTAFVDLIKNSQAQLIADVPLPTAFMQTDNTIPGELVADIPMIEAFVRDQGPRKNSIMVVQTL